MPRSAESVASEYRQGPIRSCALAIEAKTLNAVSELAARIVLTIYPFQNQRK